MLVPLLVAALTVPVGAPVGACSDPRVAPAEVGAAASRVPAADSTLEALYASGQSFERFLAAAEARRRQWERNWNGATVPADVLAQARALKRSWRLLVIAVDGCSDSVNTVPYLARLEALAPSISMRIVHSSVAQGLMESHRTPDGRPATPTVLVLDGAGDEAGCWIERPALLQQLAMDLRAAGRIEEFQRDKQQWYDRDAGASTVREVVEALVAAESGRIRCDAKR